MTKYSSKNTISITELILITWVMFDSKETLKKALNKNSTRFE